MSGVIAIYAVVLAWLLSTALLGLRLRNTILGED